MQVMQLKLSHLKLILSHFGMFCLFPSTDAEGPLYHSFLLRPVSGLFSPSLQSEICF